jgi:hypothetical protein
LGLGVGLGVVNNGGLVLGLGVGLSVGLKGGLGWGRIWCGVRLELGVG